MAALEEGQSRPTGITKSKSEMTLRRSLTISFRDLCYTVNPKKKNRNENLEKCQWYSNSR